MHVCGSLCTFAFSDYPWRENTARVFIQGLVHAYIPFQLTRVYGQLSRIFDLFVSGDAYWLYNVIFKSVEHCANFLFVEPLQLVCFVVLSPQFLPLCNHFDSRFDISRFPTSAWFSAKFILIGNSWDEMQLMQLLLCALCALQFMIFFSQTVTGVIVAWTWNILFSISLYWWFYIRYFMIPC